MQIVEKDMAVLIIQKEGGSQTLLCVPKIGLEIFTQAGHISTTYFWIFEVRSETCLGVIFKIGWFFFKAAIRHKNSISKNTKIKHIHCSSLQRDCISTAIA